MQPTNMELNMHLRATLDMLHKLSSTTNNENAIETVNKIGDKRSNAAQDEDCHIVELEDCEGCAISCFLCQQLFTDIDELQKHLLIHFTECPENTTTKYFNCDVCGRNLRSEQELNKHHKRFHAAHMIKKDNESGNCFKCEQCNDVYVSLDFLQNHVRLAHNATEKLRPAFRAETAQIVPQWEQGMVYPFTAQPKQKYPPRSPFFNPNLWLDCDAYI